MLKFKKGGTNMGLFNVEEQTNKEFAKMCEINNINSDLFDEEDMLLIKKMAKNYIGDGYNEFGRLIGKATLDNIYNFISPRLDTIVMQNFMILKELKKINNK